MQNCEGEVTPTMYGCGVCEGRHLEHTQPESEVIAPREVLENPFLQSAAAPGGQGGLVADLGMAVPPFKPRGLILACLNENDKIYLISSSTSLVRAYQKYQPSLEAAWPTCNGHTAVAHLTRDITDLVQKSAFCNGR